MDNLALPAQQTSAQWRAPISQWSSTPVLVRASALAEAGDWHGMRAVLHQQNPEILLVYIGLAQAKVALGDPWGAVTDLEQLHLANPDNEALRWYLAAFLLAAADQSRSLTHDNLLVVTNERQLAACAGAGERILALGVQDFEEQARELLQLVSTARVWTWRDVRTARIALVVAAALGLAVVVTGGLMRNVPVVAAGVVFGAASIAGIVMYGRRQAWQELADRLAPTIRRPGLVD